MRSRARPSARTRQLTPQASEVRPVGVRRAAHAALSTRRRKAQTLIAVTVAATASAAAPIIVVSTAAASAEPAAAITPAQVRVDLTAPDSVTRGDGITL